MYVGVGVGLGVWLGLGVGQRGWGGGGEGAGAGGRGWDWVGEGRRRVPHLQRVVGRVELVIIVRLAVRVEILPVELRGHPQVVPVRRVAPVVFRLVRGGRGRLGHTGNGWLL